MNKERATQILEQLRKSAVGAAERAKSREAETRAIEGIQAIDIALSAIRNVSELRDLVSLAHEWFTDNDMQPPNHILSVWLARAGTQLSIVNEQSLLCDRCGGGGTVPFDALNGRGCKPCPDCHPK